MKRLPKSQNALVLRTDFSDQAAWETIRDAIRAPVGEFHAYVTFVEETAYDGLTRAQLLELFDEDRDHTFVIVADRTSMADAEHVLLVVALFRERGREFRAIPSQIQSIENNLSIANMDFHEFADSVDDDGVFRGFPLL
jgi:hypothetical protein